MPSLLQTQRDYRRRLLAADRQTAGELVRVYADLQAAISEELRELTEQIRLAQLRGETINQSWLFRQQRYRSLLQQADSAYRDASRIASGEVTRAQQTSTQLGSEAAQQLVRSLTPPQIPLSWSLLPQGAIQSFVGFASDGSPLSDLFDALGPEGSHNIRSALLRGITLGYNPRKIARLVNDQVGISLTRALTISRTEVIRSYRQSSADSYRANRDVLKAKMWHAELDDRTCPVCWSGHGMILALNDSIASHVNCRCTEIPVTRSWEELGYDVPDTNPTIVPGVERFATLPSERQAAILGRDRFAAYSEGRLGLEQMIGMRVSRRWGPTRYVLPLRDALEKARAA